MGVYIKGMEMPVSCYYCPFADGSWGYSPPHKKRCLISGKDMPVDERYVQKNQPVCPLVSVPPHGDLIDRREAIIDANERAYDFWLSDDEVNATIQFLNEQTAIIPAKEGET